MIIRRNAIFQNIDDINLNAIYILSRTATAVSKNKALGELV